MLNLNAMFGSCESIFGAEVPRRDNEYKVSSTELQMMEMEISTDLANAEVDDAKISSTTMQLDQLLNMYNHVKQYGIDRTFLSLYNSNNQLSSMLGVKFPSCESVDSEGYPNSNISKVFLAAMEDEKEGVFAKIVKVLKWIWEKIKYICSVVWNKIKSWIGLGTKRNKVILDEAAEAVRNGAKPKSIKRIITKKRVAATVAVITATIAAIYAYKKYGKKNAASSESPEIKNAEANLKKVNDNLAKIEQEEKSETIENPTQHQIEEIIKDAREADAETVNVAKTVDNVEKELKTEVEKSEKMFLLSYSGSKDHPMKPHEDPKFLDPQWLRDSINATKNYDDSLQVPISREDLSTRKQLYSKDVTEYNKWIDNNAVYTTECKAKIFEFKQLLKENRSAIKNLTRLTKLNSEQMTELHELKSDRAYYKKRLTEENLHLKRLMQDRNDLLGGLGRNERYYRDSVTKHVNYVENESKKNKSH